ncbi:MAG: sulfatase-like hydrolase/transferase [Acidobacteria bacterium]|nr:sulfatase-like hydrolase/transferase [Acidobacteriota bacterium]
MRRIGFTRRFCLERRGTTHLLCAALIFFGSPSCSRSENPEPSRSPSIILISVDTLRADHLPAYGYDRVSTPAIDSLAADSIVFDNASTNVPLTLPAHVSALTGAIPPEHGVRNNIGFHLDSGTPSITEALRRSGYRTGAFVSSWVLRDATGLDTGFDQYDDEVGHAEGVSAGELQRRGTETVQRAVEWIEQESEPFFAFVHLYEPHAPWSAPEPFASRHPDSHYDAEIEAADSALGHLLTALREGGLYDESLIIFMSDHGEGLGDHGELEHGVFLYREALHVPLMVKLPGGRNGGSREAGLVDLTDIAPTIAAVASVPFDAPDGRSLLSAPHHATIYAETLYPRFHLGWSELYSVADERFQMIEAPAVELYDYVDDPREQRNIASTERRALARLREHLAAIDREIVAPTAVDPEEAARLSALGYVGSVRNPEGSLPDPKDRIGDLDLLREASAIASSGEVLPAIGKLQSLVGASPAFTEGWILLADLLDEAGEGRASIDAWKSAMEASPELLDELALSAGAAMLAEGELEDAAEHARLALGGNPGGAHLLLARIARRKGNGEEARREAALAKEYRPLAAAVVIADSYLDENRLAEAEAELGRARAIAAKTGQSVVDLESVQGDLHARQSEWDLAARAFEREIAANPRNLRPYTSLAVVMVFANRPERVDAIIERMVEANPTPRAREAAATTYETLGDAQTAQRWRERALRGSTNM